MSYRRLLHISARTFGYL